MNSQNPVSKCAVDQGIVPLTREKNNELYKQLRETSGDEQEVIVQQMIEGNMALVFGRVNDFIDDFHQFGYLRDDLISECFLALTRAVRALASIDPPENPNPVGFISYSLYHANLDLAFSEGGIPVARDIQLNHRVNKGEANVIPKVVSFDDQLTLPDINAYRGDTFLKLIESLCFTNDELKIIQWRVEGYLMHEIAANLGIGTATVFRKLRTIYHRYQQKLAENTE